MSRPSAMSAGPEEEKEEEKEKEDSGVLTDQVPDPAYQDADPASRDADPASQDADPASQDADPASGDAEPASQVPDPAYQVPDPAYEDADPARELPEEEMEDEEGHLAQQPLPPDGTTQYWLLLAVLVGIVALLMSLYSSQPLPVAKAPRQVEDFLREMIALEARFHSQRPDLWNRSRIHLKRHLLTALPTEPVSLILAAGRGAERTLYCLAQGLAAAYSAAHNASDVLLINGAAEADRDSDQVKMDIDRKLTGAFRGGEQPAAVVHRFEELPPGSTLIFYRYCDHENAAYKRTFLLFTVLLEEPEVAAEASLSAVEELVDDQLQKKFLSPGGSVAFDTMDRDKYSGLWSRISHLVLPVDRQPLVERDGC